MTKTLSVTPFTFENNQVRAIVINNEPWFVAQDLCSILEIKNVTQAIDRLDDDERSMFNIGRQGEVNIVSESGMYTLILRCRGAVKSGTIPHRVRKWVTNEVLPSIRKTGYYSIKENKSQKALPDKLTAEQQEAIKQLVLTRGKALPKEHQAKGIITLWSALKAHFGCTYKDIDSSQFAEALSIAARVPLEGEYIGKAESPPPAKTESSQEILDLYYLNAIHEYFSFICNTYKQQLEPGLMNLGSPVAVMLNGRFSEGASFIGKLKTSLEKRAGCDMVQADKMIMQRLQLICM